LSSERVESPADSPNCEVFASWSASLKSFTRITASTGPKTSSCAIRIVGVTSANSVGDR
jgi:hypothetical protein